VMVERPETRPEATTPPAATEAGAVPPRAAE